MLLSTKPLNFLVQVNISSLYFSIYSVELCVLVRSQILYVAIQSLSERLFKTCNHEISEKFLSKVEY